MGADASRPAEGVGHNIHGLTEAECKTRCITKMDAAMRKKYARGAKYNFKVVIRGDSSTGKSTLMRRLRGGTFVAEYNPSPEIKTAHVQWTARSSPEDNVMLEVWDVVDKASKRAISESLTLAHKGDAADGQHTFPLDATMVDVYQGCHAAVFMMDPSKKWTYEYVQRELASVPEHIPTCVLLNFRDYPASKRLIRAEEVEADVGYAFGKRPFRPFVIEVSLLNCYGLQSLSTFLHIPFLCLKRAALEQAMQLNTHAIVQAQEALKTIKSTSYEQYEKKIEQATGANGAVGGNSAESGGSGTSPEAPPTKDPRKEATGPKEAAITWEKLSKTTLGEAPILLGAAAVSAIATGVTAVASTTPAEIAENVKGLASLKTLGIGAPREVKNKTNFVPADPNEKVAPQFSHLAGRGGAAAAAFGGADLDDDDGAPLVLGTDGEAAQHPDIPGGGKAMDHFLAGSPRAEGDSDDDGFGGRASVDGDDEDGGDGRGHDVAAAGNRTDDEEDTHANGRDWDSDDDGADTAHRPLSVNVRWDEDDDSDAEESTSPKGSDGEGVDDPSSPPVAVVRQISKEDPFFGPSVNGTKGPKNVANLGRSVDVDLDPSAIAAAFGSPGAGAVEDYEPVKTQMDLLSSAISMAEGKGPGKGAGSGNLTLYDSDSDSDGGAGKQKKKEKKKKKDKGSNGSLTSSDGKKGKKEKASKKAEKGSKKADKEADKGGKKKARRVKDWDESSDSD